MLSSKNAFLGDVEHESWACCSIAAFYDQIFLGMEDGRVTLVSQTQEGRLGGRAQPTLEYRIPGGRPVMQLVAMGEVGLIFALSGGTVESIDTQRMTPRPDARLLLKSEVQLLCVNEDQAPDFSICLATSHKLHLYKWAGEKHEPWKILNIASMPRDIAWSGQTFCVALEDQIALVDVPSQITKKVHDLVPASPSQSRFSLGKKVTGRGSISSGMDMAKKGSTVRALPGGQFIMCIESVGIIIKASGEPSGSAIVWSSPPSVLACSAGFVLSLHNNGELLEVHSVAANLMNTASYTSSCAETLQLEQPAIDIFAPAPWNAVSSRGSGSGSLENLTSGGGVLLLNAHHPQVSKLGTISLEKKMRERFEELDISGALHLLQTRVLPLLPKDGENPLDSPSQALLRLGAAEAATQQKQIDTMCSPVFLATSRKDAFMRFYLAAGLAILGLGHVELAFEQFNKGQVDPRELIPSFQGLLLKDSHSGPFLLSDMLLFEKDSSQNVAEDLTTGCKLEKLLPLELQGHDACPRLYREMTKLLWSSRSVLMRNRSDEESQLRLRSIEFALLRLLLLISAQSSEGTEKHAAEEDLRTLCRGPNFLDIESDSNILLGKGRTELAALLYSSSETFWRKALKLWSDMGCSEDTSMVEEGINESIHFLQQHHNDFDLVLVFSAWILRKDPDRALQIFVAQSGGEPNLPPEKVLEHLSMYDEIRQSRLRLRYLRFLCVDLKQHNFDVDLGIEFLQVLSINKNTFEEEKGSFLEFVKHQDTLTRKIDPAGDLESADDQFPNVDTMEAEVLLEHMEKLGLTQRLSYARVELLAKCGWHGKALEVLVNELGDHERAEEYCIRMAHESGTFTATDNPFLDLLCIYFASSENTARFKEASLHILEKHGSKIDPAHIVAKLPAELPVCDLQTYLSLVFTQSVRRTAQLRMEKNLCAAQNIKVRNHMMRKHMQNISITHDTRCSACNQPIRTDSFTLDPSRQSVKHSTCPP